LRLAAAIVLGLIALVPIKSEAAVSGGAMTSQPHSNVVEAAVRCGRGAHYVRGHRTRSGQWVKGRCVWDKPRRRR
jgi:hypothetical protein